MKLVLSVMSMLIWMVMLGCSPLPPGQITKHTTPGHVQQYTGCNPKSGKCKQVPKVSKVVKPADIDDLFD